MWEAFVIVWLLMSVIIVIIYYRRREKKLIEKLQIMLDSFVAGKYDVSSIDESTLSALENSLNRFLADCEVSSKNLSIQKDRIQTLISDISHQTITPISNVLLYAQLLEEKDSKNFYGEEVAAIKEQTQKLSFLIESLVKVSRLENGIITVKAKLNSVQEMIETVLKQVRSKAENKQIALLFKDTETMAVFDMKWTVEAVYNIVDNAIKYTPEHGRVSIQVIPYSVYLRIDVNDNGIGISEGEYSKIFGRFYRAPEVSEEEGVGIGLFLAREIISEQGGYIKVESKLGEGSNFSVFLPM
ncbi:MAG TPA: HAMP domain-containing sensor histidine kinase [Lachnospiraceae bacterium]|nr:HAMP domain-containing sensor histidine kinase [Lachnospiraceae bacterium]